MDFFNIGGGELLVIILLALVLFRPEDIYKAMRTLGRYTRSARGMWTEFSTNIKREMDAQEVEDALKETKGLMTSAQEAVNTLRTSVSDVKKTVEADVSEAGKSLKSQATESAAAVKAQAAAAGSSTAPKVTVEALSAVVSAASADARSVIASAGEAAAGAKMADDQPEVAPEVAGVPAEASEAEVQVPEADDAGEGPAEATGKGEVSQLLAEGSIGETAESVAKASVSVDLPEAEPADVEPVASAAPQTDLNALTVTEDVGAQPDTSPVPLSSEPSEES